MQLVAQDRRLGMARPALQRLRAEAGEMLDGCGELAGDSDEPEEAAELARLRDLLLAFEQPLSALVLEAETALDAVAACGDEASRPLRSASLPRHSISCATPRSSSAAAALAATPRSEERRRSSIALEGAEALLLRGKQASGSSNVVPPPMSPLQRAASAPAGGCLEFESPAATPRQSQEVPNEDIADSEEVLQLAQVIEELTDALEEAQGAEWEARRLLEDASNRLRAEQDANAQGLHAEDQEVAALRQHLDNQTDAIEAERERAAGLELEFMRLELQTALANAKSAELAGKKGFSASFQYKA